MTGDPITPATTDGFWHDYRALVARILEPLGDADGVPVSEVAQAEERLGFRLPRLLREVYLFTGRRDDIHGAQEYLADLEGLEVLGGNVLHFYEENQAVSLWGVHVDAAIQDDPPVLQAENDDTLAWEAADCRLSEFLLSMLFRQAVSGGMPCVGIGAAEAARLLAPPEGWTSPGQTWAGYPLLKEGQLLFVAGSKLLPEDGLVEVYGGARSPELMEQMAAAFGMEWGYQEELSDAPPPQADPAAVEARRREQREKARTPFGDAICAGCEAPLAVWADTPAGGCAR